MIGLDTNVLVRLVVGDDPQQTQQARRGSPVPVGPGEQPHELRQNDAIDEAGSVRGAATIDET
jgi:hypothetical protein